MKITKTIQKEYDLKAMALWELRDFLEEYHDIKTQYEYIDIADRSIIFDVRGEIIFTIEGNHIRVNRLPYQHMKDWYINKIKELENENN